MKRQKRQIILLLVSIIPESILESTLIPLYPFIVRHLLPNEPESAIGYYTGMLGSAFYLPLFVMNLFWGSLSDRIGRKPVLVAGLVACLITTVATGISSSYSMVVACRFIAGCFGANSTVVKGAIGDLSARNQKLLAWGFTAYGSLFSMAGILGPVLSAFLSNPVKLYPSWFAVNGMFAKYPYLLTCIFVAVVCLLSLLVTVALLLEKADSDYQRVSETAESELSIRLDEIPRDSSMSRGELHTSVEPGSPHIIRDESIGRFTELTSANELHDMDPEFKLWSWKTIAPVILYCIIAYTNMAYYTSIPLFFSASRDFGGLNLTEQETSLSITLGAAAKLAIQLFVFRRLLFYLKGPVRTYRYGMALFIPAHFFAPLLVYAPSLILVPSSCILMCLFGIAETLAYMSILMQITESAQQKHLGLAHGFASTMAALVRTAGPGLTGNLWSFGVVMRMNWIVFAVGVFTASIGILFTYLD